MLVISIILVGVGTCVVFDLWQRVFQKMTGIPTSNWAIVGRWLLGVMSGGPVIASGLTDTPPRANELAAGWVLHYAVAIGYAVIYAALMLLGWLSAGWEDGLVFGVVSVVVPWFFFMPALGNGVMARNTPKPSLACAVAVIHHAVFGVSIGIGFGLNAA